MMVKSQMTYAHTPLYSVDKPIKPELDGDINISRTSARWVNGQSLVMDKENACMLYFTQISQACLSIRIVIDWD
jgi:hypothetical protein